VPVPPSGAGPGQEPIIGGDDHDGALREAQAGAGHRSHGRGGFPGSGGGLVVPRMSISAPAPGDLGAPRDLLLRVSRLADDLPEVTELDLNPVIARPDGAYVVDARIKMTPYQAQDPFLRQLR
jgi:ATP-grasp domain